MPIYPITYYDVSDTYRSTNYATEWIPRISGSICASVANPGLNHYYAVTAGDHGDL